MVAGKPVALANDVLFHLACGGELEAFFDAALRLELGHFRLLSCDVYGRPRQPTLAGQSLQSEAAGYKGDVSETQALGNGRGAADAAAPQMIANEPVRRLRSTCVDVIGRAHVLTHVTNAHLI